MQAVIDEIGRLHPAQRNRETTWLADALHVRVQVVQNWKSRGIPADKLHAVGRAIGWTSDQVAGRSVPHPRWPFEAVPYERFNALSERQKGVIEQAMLDAMDKVERNQAGDPSRKRDGTDG